MALQPVQNVSYDREIGSLQAAVQALTDALRTQATYHEKMLQQQSDQYNLAVADFKQMVKDANTEIMSLRTELEEMKGIIREAKGGWKVLVGIGTISAVVGGIVTKLLAGVQFVLPR